MSVYKTIDELTHIIKDNKIYWTKCNNPIKCQFVHKVRLKGKNDRILCGAAYELVKRPTSRLERFFTRKTRKLMWRLITDMASTIQIGPTNRLIVSDKNLPTIWITPIYLSRHSRYYMPWLIKFNKKQYAKALENMQ